MSDQIDTMFSVAQGIAAGKTGHEFVYCMDEDKYYIYADEYWKRINEIELMSIALKHFNGENNTVNITRYTASRRAQIPDNLRYLIFKKLEVFNANGYLNFPEGEMDMETGYVHNHDKENYSTLRMPYNFRMGADCQLWLKSLDEIFEKEKDPKKCAEKIAILQEFFGYCLTRDTEQRKALLLIGESNCGKSTILWTLRNMLGDHNCSSVSMKNISNAQFTSSLMNKAVNIDTDVSTDAREYEEAFKKIAGGEPVNCNSKYLEPFDFFPWAKIIMASNGFPRCSDHSDAFFNRLIIIPCERIFEENEQNKKLPKLLKEELPGIFNWAWEGLKRLNARGQFDIKDFVAQARQDLRDESNPIDVFFRETITADKEWNSYIFKKELYQKYIDWCRDNGNSPMSNIKFNKAIFQKYSRVTERDSKLDTGERVWRCLRLRDNTPTPPPPQKDLAWDE